MQLSNELADLGMPSNFRVAIGRCACRGPRPSNPLVAAMCDRVLATIEQLRLLSRDQLFALAPQQHEECHIGGRAVSLSVYRDEMSDGSVLVVVQAFVATWRRPTFLSLSGPGHIVAEGLTISQSGEITDAVDEQLWAYR